jgi:serine/threonine-protein kinase
MNSAKPSVETILADAVEIAAPLARQAYLEQACAGDAALQRRLESLIANYFQAGSFLEQPMVSMNPEDIADGKKPEIGEGPGTVIGPYKLLEQIGEGGMGLVFMAEQTQPVRRKVALKVLKPGMDTRQVVARFAQERQALALMDHPNIAKFFDAGTTGAPLSPLAGKGVGGEGSGRPYFVMELVRGVPITEFCDQRRFTTRQRLDLFVAVCQAVQHAHQKGIIHRDLKPSNVLVTLHDVVAVPKVIDFGIAKATTQRLTERTLFTHFAQMVGTPLYMSPEQAEMSGLDVDTRSDVYSLGVLLYELLTGTTPFESETLKKVGLDEMRRLIREEEPPRPSQRVSTLAAEACTTVSERRGVDGRRLGQVLRGELDWIVMKALEKDRNRRYESASALAADVQRYLRDEPVEACPPSAGYRLRKFARRNRRVLVTAGLFAAVLVAAAAVSAWQAVVARDAQYQAESDRDRAKTAEQQAKTDSDRAQNAEGKATTNLERAKEAEKRATTEAAIARAVNTFLQEDLLKQAGSAPDDGLVANRDPDVTVREALRRASAGVGERFRDQPAVEAAIRTAIGDAYGSLGDYRLAAKHLERALELRRTHLGQDDQETLRVMENLADAYTWIGRCSDAIVMNKQLVESAKSRLHPDDPELLRYMTSLARVYRRAGDWQKAMRLLEQLIEKDKAVRGATRAGASENALILAWLYQDAGLYKESADRLDQVLALRKRLGADPDAMLPTTDGRIPAYQLAGRYDEADRLIRRNLGFWRKRADSLGQIRQAGMLEALSLNLLLQNRPEEAEPLAREALAIREKNRTTQGEWQRPYVMNLLGGIFLAQVKYDEAEPLLLRGYEGMKQAEDTMNYTDRFRLTEAGKRVVRFYEETNQPEKVRAWQERLREDKTWK